MKLTQDYLKSILDYNPDTGIFIWKVNPNDKKKVQLGSFDNIEDACFARWEGEKKYNYPNCNTTSSAYRFLKVNNLI